ncbi:hypothetical protein ACFQV2_07715 [Actinokineospora soli]|uniref:Cytochrome P450 n=1 Tax=Actinokineospora soli TaxID=1048753 RepID=A0ABW2TJU7_9PSEU
MENRCPALDTTGQDIHGEAARLRSLGPVRVELPGGVLAWSLNSYDHIKRVLTDPNVTKSARNHWPAFINGEIPPDWEMISWIAMDNMVTSYGKDHVRLRKLVGKAFTPRRTEAIRPRVVELTQMLIAGLEAAPRARSSTCAPPSPTRCPRCWLPTSSAWARPSAWRRRRSST